MDFPGLFVDRIMPDKIHNISLSFLVDKLTKQFGGTAGNIAYSLSLLGVRPILFATAGNDFAPYQKFLMSKHVETKYIKKVKNIPTSSYFVVTDNNDNQIGSFYVGASEYNKSLEVSNIREKLDFAVVAPNNPTANLHFVSQCRKHAIPYLYDPAFQISNYTPEQLLDGIEGAAIVIGNDYEIALIEQKLGVSHRALVAIVPVLITTLGSKGSIVETQKEAIHIKIAKPKDTSDPTGAGDAYRAGFIAGFLRGLDLKVCGQMGSVAAAYTVEKYGTVTHEYTQKEFIARYKENFGTLLIL
jgi:adenosine kinase